jgi:RES domain-containing protein
VILWRVSNYADLDGKGGVHVAGRWHSKGRPVVYCSQNPATALLETLVHIEIDSEDRPDYFQLLKIDGPDPLSFATIALDSLSSNWGDDISATQQIGDRWLCEKRCLLLFVPSVSVPESWNVLVNPEHAEIRQLKITAAYRHPFDARLRAATGN